MARPGRRGSGLGGLDPRRFGLDHDAGLAQMGAGRVDVLAAVTAIDDLPHPGRVGIEVLVEVAFALGRERGPCQRAVKETLRNRDKAEVRLGADQ